MAMSKALPTGRRWIRCSALLALLLVACDRRPSSAAAYDKLLAESVRYLDAQLETNRQVFRIDSHPRYDWSQEKGELVFSDAGVPKVVATIQVVGDFSGASKTWLWAWNLTPSPGCVFPRLVIDEAHHLRPDVLEDHLRPLDGIARVIWVRFPRH